MHGGADAGAAAAGEAEQAWAAYDPAAASAHAQAYAAQAGQVPFAAMLLDAGADPDLASAEGWTATMYAAGRGGGSGLPVLEKLLEGRIRDPEHGPVAIDHQADVAGGRAGGGSGHESACPASHLLFPSPSG